MALLMNAKDPTNVKGIWPKNGTNFKLAELYAMLDVDLVEVVHLTDTDILIVDEEGLLKADPILNLKASSVAGQPIVGNALLCKTSEFR